MENTRKKISIITVIKVITLLLMVMFFVPLFTVSCNGREYKISAARMASGYSDMISRPIITGPNIICGMLLVIPIFVFLASIVIRKIRSLNLFSIISGLINIIILIVIIVKAQKHTEAGNMELNIGVGFYLSLLLNLILVVISVCVLTGLAGKIPILKNIDTSDTLIRICSQCGHRLRADDIFCSKCGTKYGETNNYISYTKFCTNCGKELGEEDNFCTNCGCKVE